MVFDEVKKINDTNESLIFFDTDNDRLLDFASLTLTGEEISSVSENKHKMFGGEGPSVEQDSTKPFYTEIQGIMM